MSTWKYGFGALCAVAVAFLALVVAGGPRPGTPSVGSASGDIAASAAPPSEPVAVRAPNAEKPSPSRKETEPSGWNGAAFANTLADTEIDGHLFADERGALVVDLSVRDFFDYFLSTVGTRSLEEVLAEIERQIATRLPASAVEEARQLLHEYVAYQQAQASLLAQPAAPKADQDMAYYAETMSDAFDRLRTLRRNHFSSSVVDAFFGVEEAFGEYTVQTLKVRADARLTEPERQAKLKALESKLPASVVATAKTAALRQALATEARSALATGTDEAALREKLSAAYSAEEIDGMLAFWASEADWRSRRAAYGQARSALMGSMSAGPARQEALVALQRRYFGAHEQARLAAEDAMAARRDSNP